MENIKTFLQDCYNYLKETIAAALESIEPKMSGVITQIGFYFSVYLLVCYITYVITTLFRHMFTKSNYFESQAKRVLLVIAHPDDECMFFGPLIVRLVKSGKSTIYVLCLSSGDSKNQGHLRKQELYESCKVLGIPTENIILCCSSLRLDGQQYMWKSDIIATLILDYVEVFDIDTIVTFDKDGVSGHQNHCSLYRAISYLKLRNWLPINCRIFLLDSLGLMRKYSSLLDCVWSLYTSENVFILSIFEHGNVMRAMSMHKTQLVWYRKLYMLFSRYTYINTLNELPRFQTYI